MVEATRKAAKVGRWVAGGMAIVGLATFHLILLLIASFVWLAGKQEEAAVRLRYAQAPIFDFDPRRGWQQGSPWGSGPRRGPSPRPGGDGHRRPTYSTDPREVEEALRRLKERLRGME
jgi:hypothetical protein